MDTFILELAEPGATLENVGGKGLSLAKMFRAGLPVPGGFHLTTAAYQRFISENGLQPRILAALAGADASDPATLETVAQAIGQWFAEGEMPAEVAQALLTAYTTLFHGEKEVAVAVRSSATAEDLPEASFAGQQETYLNIRGAQAVLAAVKKCWASLWTARAIAYRIKNHIDPAVVTLAVVVQELVPADSAGILFTANPLNGRRDEMVINASWGLGEAIVSGAVTPDTLTVKKASGRIVRRVTAEKVVMTVRTPAGTREEPVPSSLKKKAVLRAAQVVELVRLGVKIEQFFGQPMDVEWTLTLPSPGTRPGGGGFAIVQARPITALPPEWKIPDPKSIYARGSLAEHTPSPVTPLFATLGLELANQATAQMWVRMVGEPMLALLPPDGFYSPIHGYVFGGVRMQGKDLLTILKLSLAQMSPMFRGSVARWQAARQEFAAVVEDWEQKPIETLTPAELLAGARTVFGAACHYFTDIQTVLPAASSSEVLFTTFYRNLVRRKNDPEAGVFLLGFETTTLRAEKSLFDLATWLIANPALAEYMRNAPTETLLADLVRPDSPQGMDGERWVEWRARFERHQHEFGRTAYEFDFASATALETPGPLVEALKGFLEGRAQDPYQRQRAAIEKREGATQMVLRRLGWPRKSWFEKLLRWTQETGPMREDSIFDMGMGHPVLRRVFAELARRFVASGALTTADDLYWLEKTEVEALVGALEHGEPLPDLAGRIPERKAQWRAYLLISPPVMLPERSGWSKLMHGGDAVRKDGKLVLKGVATSGGRVTAPARVLLGPEDFGKFKPGDVLVAVTTTPAWTPLFALASAVVTDIGGPLSHSSIVAREYGIPAVMAARGATHHIQSGRMVTVDGNAGTVIVAEE